MQNKKIIAVIGATGAQGGGLARAILNDPQSEFSVRALTRNPESENALALAAAGAEVVTADLNDQTSLENAFEGAYGAFCVTNFWETLSPEIEQQQAHNMAQAAQTAGLQHVVWSTLEDTRQWVPLEDDRMPTLMGKYKVPHFDGKATSNSFFKDAGVPTTFLLTSFYWDNLIYFGMGPQKGDDGNLYFTLPMEDKKLPGIAVEDIGRCAYGVFKKGEEFIGKSVGIAGDHLTGDQMAEALSRSLGQEIHYNAIDHEIYRNLDIPGAADLGNMFQFKCDFESDFCGARDLQVSRSLNPQLQSFDQWLEQYKEHIPTG